MDVFGNYVLQKMFEQGNQLQKKAIYESIRGNMYTLSMD